jgi:putative transposase
MAKPIRCDKWKLLADADTVRMAADTVKSYRKMANALATVFLTHWPQVHDLPVQHLESFFHDTARTKDTTYGAWFKANFRKFPAYLRRAATMAAHGAVSSFMTRYRTWQGGSRKMRAARPPTWGGINSWPVLYAAEGGAGAMVRKVDDAVHLKLLDVKSGDWLWHVATVVKRGVRHAIPTAVPKSPALMLKGSSLSLMQPFEFTRPCLVKDDETPDRVCSVDQGINKQATCSIVCSDGTVTARTFISLGAHIDRRDKVLQAIRNKATQTAGHGGKLCKGFCRTLYRRAAGINLQISRDVSRMIHTFAKLHGAKVVVFEDLEGWRPKGGAKRSNLKAKFHGWLHRLVVEQAVATGEERGIRVDFVHPRGTSAWAYDGSGRVVRDKFNYGLARFRTGKEYDCDLSASYNIAARWFARHGRLPDARTNSPAGGKTGWPVRGKTSAAGPGAPVTLSSLWLTPLHVAA